MDSTRFSNNKISNFIPETFATYSLLLYVNVPYSAPRHLPILASKHFRYLLGVVDVYLEMGKLNNSYCCELKDSFIVFITGDKIFYYRRFTANS